MPSSRSAAATTGTGSTGGVTIERRFTEPGVHPFDAVEWEIRDALIGDPAKPAFEQRGVEFPTAWSQNATNIVAQKYFRGRAGSEEREHSVRQMVGRVAGTIAGWGRELGYFSTDEDGEAFEAELTHILLHQMAAFNSPVWFNVGFEESPQCSACQPYHALVSTPDGLVPIGEMVEGDQVGREVYDSAGTTRIVAVKANGLKPVRRVRLRNGSYIEATPDHVVKAVTSRRAEPIWLRVDQLRPGMRLHHHPHRAKVEEPALVGVGCLDARSTDSLDAIELDGPRRVAAEAALAGWLQADGFVGQYESGTNRSLTIEFQVANDDEHDWVIENLDVALPHVHRHVRDVDSKDDSLHIRRIRLYGEALRDFVDAWGLSDRGVDIRVPSRLWTAPHDEIVAYLRSVFQADGHVTVRRDNGYANGRVAFAVISERWTEDIQLLLNVVGVYSRRTRKRERRDNRRDLHEVAISIGSERARFAELIGFVAKNKQRKLLESLELRGLKACPDLREEEIVAIDDIGQMEVFDIQTESGEYLSNNVAVHNCFILSVEDTIESILDWNTKEGMIFRGGSGSGINLSRIRSSQESLSKGGLASGPVSFMRGADAWAGTIKSGGKTRRAAKMVVLDVDHPDVLDFIWCKAREEEKAAALRDAGFDMRLDSESFASIQYQNANNSVRVTDEFMERAERGEDWELTARVDGRTLKTLPAREVLDQIAEAAWKCADPGVQYDSTINEWHTCPNSGRINASNPCCFTGETLVHTIDGPVRFDALHERVAAGEELPEIVAYDDLEGRAIHAAVADVWVAGMTTRLVEVETDAGVTLRCTPEHRFLLAEGGYVEARHLARHTKLRTATPARSYAGVAGSTVAHLDHPESDLDTVAAVRQVELAEPVAVYDLEVPATRNFSVTSLTAETQGIVVHNSEYMHVDDSACNLASINLLKFRRPDGSFDVGAFEHTVDVMILAQEIVVGPSSYPTEEIAKNARDFRQLGLGYANLGALLMADGLPYDSEEGRAVCGAITSLMTGRAYRKSAEVAAAMGPYARYYENQEPHLHVMRKHRDAAGELSETLCPDRELLDAARRAWDEAVELGERHGYRNAQATVLAPTGCLVGDSLVATSRGLVRMRSLGDTAGETWQPLDVEVATDDGPRQATQFYVNGMESVVSVETARGYRIQGTPTHRVKVVDASGDWAWRRMADLEPGDRVPMMLGGFVGEPQEVELPPLGDLHWNAGPRTRVPRRMTAELAELVGYFMGDGSLHAKGLRLCVAGGDEDVVERLARLGADLFGLEAHRLPREGYTELSFHSVPLTIWWEACGFAKLPPYTGHSGKGWVAQVPDAVLHSNDPQTYAAFVRGLFEADGNANHGYAHWSTTSEQFSRDVQTLLLTLGFVTTRSLDAARDKLGGPCHRLRLLNASSASRFVDEVGFIAQRKNDALQLARNEAVSRRSAATLLERAPSTELEHLLGYFYDSVQSIELLEDQPTFDLSVPDNVTYVANGFVSHNTISFLMDCDTTGIEPDFSLVKFKELVGGGQMTIVNRTVPPALRTLGYSEAEIERIEAHLAEEGTIIGAPGLKEEHLPVFDVAVGERAISHMGHIEMMAAAQPFISGAISKTVNLPETATVEDVADAYLQGWKLGLKALAIYRDGSKTAQALRTDAKREKDEPAPADAAEARPQRRRMPKERQSLTHKFSIAGHEGYITAGMYEDGSVGEIFLTDIGKEGSTLRGMMNAFATSVSIALQYGVPLETLVRKFSYMRFDPEGITTNPEIPFAKSMPDYIMRWLCSRFCGVDLQEELGILTPEVRARKAAQDALMRGDTVGPANGGNGHTGGSAAGQAQAGGSAAGPSGAPRPAADAITDDPPVTPARLSGLDLGPACGQCGGMMQRTGSCYTCSSCGNNTGCG